MISCKQKLNETRNKKHYNVQGIQNDSRRYADVTSLSLAVTIHVGASIVSCLDSSQKLPLAPMDDHRHPHLNLIQITALLSLTFFLFSCEYK